MQLPDDDEVARLSAQMQSWAFPITGAFAARMDPSERRELIKDIIIEVWLELWCMPDPMPPIVSWAAYLRGVLFNKCMEAGRGELKWRRFAGEPAWNPNEPNESDRDSRGHSHRLRRLWNVSAAHSEKDLLSEPLKARIVVEDGIVVNRDVTVETKAEDVTPRIASPPFIKGQDQASRNPEEILISRQESSMPDEVDILQLIRTVANDYICKQLGRDEQRLEAFLEVVRVYSTNLKKGFDTARQEVAKYCPATPSKPTACNWWLVVRARVATQLKNKGIPV